ncbi:MAG: Fic family protein [Planctomycetes bacterium]|nr:Fic family protein [Planctomycetota bacterium]
MDIPSPSDVSVDQVTQELILDATELERQVNERRPLPAEVIHNIQKELLGERVYNSNAIEGNTLTLRETKSVLETGGIIDVGRKREATEAINLGKAIAEVQELVGDRESWCDVARFTAVHRTLLTDVKDDAAGATRSERVMITGAKHQPPNPMKLDALLEQFFGELRDATNIEPIRLATWVHWTIARIHPFLDGNGRMARLWQDLILFGHQFTAAVIRQQDRNEYYLALSSADDGEFDPLTQLVARSLSKTLQIYINAQREVDELKDWATDIVGESNARLDQQRKLEYLRWVRQMEQLRDAFERCATQVTSASDGTIEVQVRSFDIVDQSTWETLRAGGRAGKTWFFWMNFRRGEERIQYCFFFGHHFFSPADSGISNIGPNACLLISEQIGDEAAVRLTELGDCPVTLREVVTVNHKIARKRLDIAEDLLVYDLDIDPLSVAREFVQEVLLNRMA